MRNQKKNVSELVDDPSFIRWATGKANHDEISRWDEWVEASETNRKLAVEAQRIITGISFDEPSISYQDKDWTGIDEKIRLNLKQRAIQSGARRPGNRNLSVIVKAAAILLIIAVSGLTAHNMYQQSEDEAEPEVSVQTITTGYSEKRLISLSNGSEIILAAGSSLAYDEDWLEQPVQQVTLLKGEAFFSIVPEEDKSRPAFEVKTEDGTTRVFGTKFSVSTYGDGTQVVLQEGEVQVTAESVGDFRSPVNLSPGEMAEWRRQQEEISLKTVNPYVYTSWTSEELYFDNTPLALLVSRIEHTYGMDVHVDDPELLEIKLSGSVDFRSLDALINAVSELLEISIKRVDDQVVIENT